jgi:hypothetical protein
MELKEIQERIQLAMSKLHPDSHIRFVDPSHTIIDDLDALDIAVAYFKFDSEAKIREAFAVGKMEGGNNVK